MTLQNLFHFYLGGGEAMRLLAADPWTLAIGALLVLSAGLARHHDTHDLRRDWWRLLVPFLASTLAASALGGVLAAVTRTKFLDVTLPLLGLFWLTAPLAWLYGLPFERLTSPARAATARRLAFGLVASGRVLLMAACVSALLGYHWWAGLLLVLGFAAPAFLLAMWFLSGTARGETPPPVALAPAPSVTDATGQRPGVLEQANAPRAGVGEAGRRVVDAMSGVGLPDHEPIAPPPDRLRARPAKGGLLLDCLSSIAAVIWVWLLLGLPGLIGPPPARPLPLSSGAAPPAIEVWLVAGLALAFWMVWVARHQPAQRRRSDFVRRLQDPDQLAAAVRDLDRVALADLPPQWDVGAEVPGWRLLEAARAAADLPPASWLRERILTRFGFLLPRWLDSFDIYFQQHDRMTAAQLQELKDLQELLGRLPEGKQLVGPYHDYLVELIAYTGERDPARAEVLRDLLAGCLKRGSARVD